MSSSSASVKLMKTVDEGQPAVEPHLSHLTCNGCCNTVAEISQIFQCSGCKVVRYCDRQCQKKHWNEHKVLCNTIRTLHKDVVEKCKKACSFSSHLTPKQRNQIVNLVGDRCMVDCCIESSETSALWDTGSQVCLVSSRWLQDNEIEKRRFKSYRNSWSRVKR